MNAGKSTPVWQTCRRRCRYRSDLKPRSGRFCDFHFSLKTVSMLAIEMFERVQTLHSAGIIHNDIKPHNFAIGRRGTVGLTIVGRRGTLGLTIVGRRGTLGLTIATYGSVRGSNVPKPSRRFQYHICCLFSHGAVTVHMSVQMSI